MTVLTKVQLMKRAIGSLLAALALAACQAKPPTPAPDPAVAAAFMADNAKKPGVKTLPSGVQYQVVTSGPESGPHPTLRDEVKVHYEGKLTNGEVFDSSFERGVPAVMPLDRLIKAWQEVIPLMRPGDEWTIYVPPAMGYGDEGGGPIPPNSVLIFRIQLLGVLPAGGGVAQG